jgi:phage replication-related protein YjqB (UPF0714/DUF867 family)
MTARNFEELVQHRVFGHDYRVIVHRRPDSHVAVIAPHGGRIEPGTSEIATAIAEAQFNLYLFEGTMSDGNYEALHLTSHRFDDIQCLALIEASRTVVAIHGCKHADEVVLIGGLDTPLRQRIAGALGEAGISARCDGHEFQASDPRNICNRGALQRGVQLEFSTPLRRSERLRYAIRAVRAVLLAPQDD